MKSFLGRLKVWQQVLLVAGLALSIGVLLAIAQISQLKADAERQRKAVGGAELIAALQPVQLNMAVHRGNTALVKAGNTQSIAAANAAADSLETALADLGKKEQAYPKLAGFHERISSAWRDLSGRVNSLDSATSFREHTQLITEIRVHMMELAQESGLSRLPEDDLFYLQAGVVRGFPATAENLGVLRGRFSGLAQRAFTEQGVTAEELAVATPLMSEIREVNVQLKSFSEHAQDAAPSLLAPYIQGITRVIEQTQSLIRQTGSIQQSLPMQSVQGTADPQLPRQYFSDASDVIKTVVAAWNDSASLLTTELERRASQAEQFVMAVIAGVVIITLLVAWIGYSVADLLRRNLGAEPDELETVARAIQGGNLDVNIESGSTGVYETLREMRDQLRDNNQRLEEQLRSNSRIRQAVDNTSTSLMIADENFNIIYVNPANMRVLTNQQDAIRSRLPEFDPATLLGKNIDVFHKQPSHQRKLLSGLSEAYSTDLALGDARFNLTANIIRDEDSNDILGYVVEWKDQTAEVNAREDIDRLVRAANAGDFSTRMDAASKEGFYRTLAENLNDLVEIVDTVTDEIRDAMQALASGDLSARLAVTHKGKFGEIADAVNDGLGKMAGVVNEVVEAAESTRASSHEISTGNRQLSERTEKQSSNLEETASAVEELTSNVRNTADNARQADQLSAQARDSAMAGGEVVKDTVNAIEEISQSSDQIAEIIGVIDDIAFQTNLLALNASVEAARAGDQGRGFAVVATEVRNLAQRSANSAREIKDLIEDSLKRVKTGAELASKSGTNLQAIIGDVKKVSDLISDIAAATEEQSGGIEEVNRAIAELDEITQQNAALAEEIASASESAVENTEMMGDALAFFNGGGRTMGVSARPSALSAAPAHRDSAPAPVISDIGGKSASSAVSKSATRASAKPSPRPAAPDADLDDSDDWEEF